MADKNLSLSLHPEEENCSDKNLKCKKKKKIEIIFEESEDEEKSEEHIKEKEEIPIDPGRKHRIKNKIYIFKNQPRKWNGNVFYCIHDKRQNICKKCEVIYKINKENDANFKSKKYCIFEGCRKQCSFGIENTNKALYCYTHKDISHVNVQFKKCKFTNCKKPAKYGDFETKISEFCLLHKQKDYLDVTRKYCHSEGCRKRPSYGIENTKELLFCLKHKEKIHVQLAKKICQHKNCKTQPSFGIKNTTKPVFCLKHKPDDYVDVINKKCEYDGCGKQPSYGSKTDKIARFCTSHKYSNHIDVVNKLCELCDKRANYGVINTKIPLFCVEHKEESHVDITNIKCQYPECEKQPTYGIPNTKEALFCVSHKEIDHINLKDNRCDYPNCETIASLGLLYSKKTRCGKHKTPNMYSKNHPKCLYSDCEETPCYTDKLDSYPLRCEDHKLDNDINISKSTCIACHQILFIKTDINLCNICAKVDIKSNRHEKELTIKKALDDNEIVTTHDKMSDSSCHKHRPDFLIEYPTHYVVIEIDEFQHNTYGECDEIIRMINIQQGFGGKPVLFIRFNPDGYKDSNNKKIRAGINTTKINRLISCIKFAEKYEPKNLLSVIKLYYDGDTNKDILFTIDVDKYINDRFNSNKSIDD